MEGGGLVVEGLLGDDDGADVFFDLLLHRGGTCRDPGHGSIAGSRAPAVS